MTMDMQVNVALGLFEHYMLEFLPAWNYHQDGIPGARVMFVTNKNNDFLITF